MFNQYGSVLCILCGSSMRLAIKPGEAGTSMETFECRHNPRSVHRELAMMQSCTAARTIEKISPLPIKYLINTHYHGDHTGGDAAFHKDGATIVAQDNIRVRLAAGNAPNGLTGAKMAAQPADSLPTDTYSSGSKIVQVGGRKAQLNHVYNAHTDGDTWVFFDDANVLDTGDTFGNTGRYNTIDFANGGDIRGLIRAADAYIKVSNDQTKIVPGHGKLANKADMIAWREMLVTSRDRIQKLVNEGKTEQEVLTANPLADLNARWAANDEQAKNWTRMVYNSFKRS